jgi:hypothetical protein
MGHDISCPNYIVPLHRAPTIGYANRMNPTDLSDPFHWELPPAGPLEKAAPQAVAFGVPQAVERFDMPVWRVDLPADPEQAADLIRQAQQQTAARQASLEALPARFDGLALRAQTGGASFAAPGVMDAESELLASLAQISSPPVKGMLSFNVLDHLGAGWAQVNEQFQAFTDRLQRTLTHLAWVETRQEGRLIGQSVVGWSGDCDTLWGAAVTAEQGNLHTRSLETALQSRANLLRTFTMAVQGAVKLSVVLSTPGGVILALPTVWKYISQILTAVNPSANGG